MTIMSSTTDTSLPELKETCKELIGATCNTKTPDKGGGHDPLVNECGIWHSPVDPIVSDANKTAGPSESDGHSECFSNGCSGDCHRHGGAGYTQDYAMCTGESSYQEYSTALIDEPLKTGEALPQDDAVSNDDVSVMDNVESVNQHTQKYNKISVDALSEALVQREETMFTDEPCGKGNMTSVDEVSCDTRSLCEGATKPMSEWSQTKHISTVTESINTDDATSSGTPSHLDATTSTDVTSSNEASHHDSADSSSEDSSKSEWSSSETEGYICLFCKAEFETAAYLEAHKKSRACLVVYKCVSCNKSFRQRIALKIHMNTHWKKYAIDVD